MSIPLREGLDLVEPLPPAMVYPTIGHDGGQLLEEVRYGGVAVPDGKFAIDSLLLRGHRDIEALARDGYAEGRTSDEIYLAAAGEPRPYVSARPAISGTDGESMVDFALRARRHQEYVVKDGENSFTLSLTCDGRYEPEIYQLDLWSVVKGLASTGEIGQVQDIADFDTRQILKHGYPFNGIRVMGRDGGDPSKDANYYAFRSQSPTYPYMIRLLGEYGGDDVYGHEPYVRAMELLWKHFNPEPALLASNHRGQFRAFHRGGLSPEGLPFSVYSDDTNNGRAFKDYTSARPESHWEDVRTAREAAARAAPEDRERVFGETLVHLAGAAEWGWDMSASRQTWRTNLATGIQEGGNNLRNINTTNIIPLELQCMLADAAEVLAYSHQVLRKRAEARGDMPTAQRHYERELYYTDNRQKRLEFIKTHMTDPETGIPHDLELVGPSGPYDSLRVYKGARRTPVVSAAIMNTLYSDATIDADQALTVLETAEERLYGPGGLAVTDTLPEEPEQWDSVNGWTTPERVGICGPVHAAAKYPSHASRFLDSAKDLRRRALHGSDTAYQRTRTLVETINTANPNKRPIGGEYPKDVQDPGTPRNFAMRREHVIDLAGLDLDVKYQKLVPVAGRFVVANS